MNTIYFLLTIYIANRLNNPPIITPTDIFSPNITIAVPNAKNGTEKIKTLALIGPNFGMAYMYIEVPNDIAPIETKKKLI